MTNIMDNIFLHIIGELQQSLRSFQSYLSAFGYETFMIVGNPKTRVFDDMTQDVTIVPILGLCGMIGMNCVYILVSIIIAGTAGRIFWS